MSKIDTQAAHKFFSANFFNTTWDFIDKETRTDEENEDMILNAMSSLMHWKLRGDATDTNISISYWQISRVYSLANNAQEASHYGHKCLEVSKDGKTPPFYLAYAYEAIALANFIAGNKEESNKYLKLAYDASENITVADNKSMILVDLDTLKAKLA
ncbi:MAG: hypothetical protein KC646_04080 [Candidatus Cloacimonetes bacterium]|nr:hypothetical protein [Candidatus Cloacimonadota bacterium]